MDEVKDIMMDNDKAAKRERTPEGFFPALPLHDSPVIRLASKVKSGDTIRYDPQTAHARANDTGYEKSLPDSCGLCQAQAIAKEAIRQVEEA